MNIEILVLILSIGCAIPSTVALIFNLVMKAKLGSQYNISASVLILLYLIALVSWAVFISSLLGGVLNG